CTAAVSAYDIATVSPGDICTPPGQRIIFNAPRDDKHTHHIETTNASGRRIEWAIKTTNVSNSACSVLRPEETTLTAVPCDSFDFDREGDP
ncbi:hypothetical protein OESDEN_21162, partial [Oesophagostomum dentatum]